MTTYYCDASSAGGNGLTPQTAFKSLADFTTKAVSGDINRPAGLFREIYSPPAGTFTYGDDANPFVVSGGELLPNLVAAVSGDADRIGANWAQFRKANILKTAFAGSNPEAANICIDGVQSNIACSRSVTTDPFFYQDPSTYWTATDVATSGGNITGFQLVALTSTLDAAQINQTKVQFVYGSNRAGRASATFSGGYINIGGSFAYTSGSNGDNFALFNLAEAAEADQWAYWDEGDGTVTIYVRNTTGVIEYSARAIGINLTGKNNITIEGFEVRQIAGTLRSTAPIIADNATPHRSNITLKMGRICECFGNGNPYAPLYLSGVDDLIVDDVEIIRAQGLYGMFLQGSNAAAADGGNPSGVVGMQRPLISNIRISYCTNSPFRFFTVHNGVFWRLFATEASKVAHGNDLNFYQGSYNNIVWAANVRGCGGYITFQESDSLVFAFCAGSASRATSGGQRWLVTQQNGVALQGSVRGYLGSALLNCQGVPLPERFDDANLQNGFQVTNGLAQLNRFRVHNNASPGWSAEKFNPAPLAWSHNVDTTPAAAISPLYGPSDIRAPNDYVDLGSGDRRLKPGAIIRTLPAYDWSGLIAGYQARWPHAPAAMWTTDLVGDTIVWSSLRRWPTMNLDADIDGGVVGEIPDTSVPILQGAATIVVTAP